MRCWSNLQISKKFMRKFKRKFLHNLHRSSIALVFYSLYVPMKSPKTRWEKGRKSNDSRLYMCARMPHQTNMSNRPFNFTPSHIDKHLSIYRIFPSGSSSKNILRIWRFRHCTGIILLGILLLPGIILRFTGLLHSGLLYPLLS
jgi:hypothetical protein